MRRHALIRGVASLAVVACATTTDGVPVTAEPVVDPPAPIVDQATYTAACEALLGTLPPLSCADAVPVAIPVTDGDGTRVAATTADLEDGFRCDTPSGLSRCTPGSRLATGTTDRGVPWVFVCRRYRTAPDATGYDQMGIVASDPTTGATCFWSTPEDGLERDDPVPHPGSPADTTWRPGRSFWYTLDELAANPCTRCHDNDAWIHTPWIEPHAVPSAPLGRYTIVAADVLGWTRPPTLVHPAAAPCLSCHRLATGLSCDLAMDAAGRKGWAMPISRSHETWPRSHWMEGFDGAALSARWTDEAAWDAAYGDAVDAIARCCDHPDDPACWAPAE